jgi:adenosine deaminase
MTTLTLDAIRRLPKTDLHVHLDGSLRLSTILELAREQRVKLPAETSEELAAAMHVGEKTGSLTEYLKAFDVTLKVLQTEASLERAAYELGSTPPPRACGTWRCATPRCSTPAGASRW